MLSTLGRSKPFELLRREQEARDYEKDQKNKRKAAATQKAFEQLNPMVERVLNEYRESMFKNDRPTVESFPEERRWSLGHKKSEGFSPVASITLIVDDNGKPTHFSVFVGRNSIAPWTTSKLSEEELIETIIDLHKQPWN